MVKKRVAEQFGLRNAAVEGEVWSKKVRSGEEEERIKDDGNSR